MTDHALPFSIKDVAALAQKKHRDDTGMLLVEGRHPIEEALKAGLKMFAAFVRPGSAESLPTVPFPFEPTHVDERTMARMADTKSPPPCLAVFACPATLQSNDNLSPATKPLVLALDELQDPGNLGALIRSAVAFGAKAIVLIENCVEPFSPKVIRASAGLVFALPIIQLSREAFAEQFASGYQVFVTSSHTPSAEGSTVLAYQMANYQSASVIVLGNEGRGVDSSLLQGQALPVQRVTIPVDSRVESLNVAICGAILLAFASAQRLQATAAAQRQESGLMP